MISVLLPTYNSDQTVEESVRSILCQSFTDYELLILDDGSTDRTLDIVHQIRDKRIKIFPLEHQGLAKTLNDGLSLAEYDIIARMDADDLSSPLRLQKQFSVLEALPPQYIISSWYAIFTSNAVDYIVETPTLSHEIKKGLLLHSYISHPGMMARKSTLLNVGGYNISNGSTAFEDYDTWLKIKDDVDFHIIPEVLLFQRYRENSLSNNIKTKQKIIYSLQAPYYNDLSSSFGITNATEENLYRGWREYFYGSKYLARKYWMKSPILFIKFPNILIAALFSFLPDTVLTTIKELRLRYRLNYIAGYYKKRNKEIRKQFQMLKGSQ